MAFRRAIVIIPIARRPVADIRARTLDPSDTGGRTFSQGLIPVGSARGTAPTHHWSNRGGMTDAEYADVAAAFGGRSALRPGWVFDGDTTSPDEALASLGLMRVQEGR